MFDQLPVEILITIFGYLPYSDRKACRLTCKHFYSASLAYSLIRNESIQIDQRIRKEHAKLVSAAIINSERSVFHVSVSDLNHYDYFWIFSKFGNTLETVSLKNCTVDYCFFSYILAKIRAVQTLRVIKCDNLLIEGKIFLNPVLEYNPHLKKLKSLEISNTIYLTDNGLNKFITLFPNISHLSLENTTINCHPGVYSFNYKNNTNILKYPSPNVLTIHFVRALINSKRTNITSLNIAKTIINNAALEQILHIKDLKLYYLNINNCFELRQSDHMLLGYWQPTLTELQIANCDLMTNDLLEHICKNMPNLKTLNLSRNNNINDLAFRYVDNLVKLSDLDISCCRNISGTIIAFVICSNNLLKSLRKVKLNQTKIEDENLMDIACMLTLVELEVSYCHRLSSVCLSTVFEKLKNLKRLEMAGIYFADSGITGLPQSTLSTPLDDINQFDFEIISQPSQQEEILKESERYYNNVVSNYNQSSPCIQDLQNLETLNLSKCRLLSDYIFATPLRLLHLRELNLAGLPLVTTKTLFFLVHNFPAIEMLDLSGCSVDDVGICVLVQKMTRLKHLYLKDCLKITNTALIFIIEHCKELNILNIQGCSNLREDLLNRVKNLPNMTEVIGQPNQRFEMSSRVPIAPPPPFYN